MNQFLDEYFKRDLTEAEEKDLAQQLASSPEAAEAFAQKAEAFHSGLGLTVPAWPGGNPPALRKAFPWFKLAFGLLLLAGGALIHHFVRVPGPSSSLPVPEEQVQGTQPVPSVKERAPQARGNGNKPAGQVPQSVQKDSSVDANQKELPPPSDLGLSPGLPLPTTPSASGEKTERLTVTVKRSQEGLATVRVVDNEGNPVRSLYAGILPAGSRSFTWDGKDDAGILSAPGRYFLEVRSGKDSFRRELDLGRSVAEP